MVVPQELDGFHDGLCHGKSHRSKWMMTRATPMTQEASMNGMRHEKTLIYEHRSFTTKPEVSSRSPHLTTKNLQKTCVKQKLLLGGKLTVGLAVSTEESKDLHFW